MREDAYAACYVRTELPGGREWLDAHEMGLRLCWPPAPTPATGPGPQKCWPLAASAARAILNAAMEDQRD